MPLTIGNLTPFMADAFRRQSRDLDLLSRGDFSPLPAEIRRVFPRTDLPIRAVPFVQRYVDELSGLYSRPVVRRFFPRDLPAETWQKLADVYTASRIDAALAGAERALWVQNSVLLLVLPAGLRKVEIYKALPWQIEVDVRDPMRAADPSAWRAVEIQIPSTSVAEQVVFGRLRLSPTEAWREVNGKQRGLYREDGSNPLGRIPVVLLHRIDPDAGRPLAPVNEAVLNLQFALSLQIGDSEHTIRHSAFPQRVINNADAAQQAIEVSWGADKIFALPKADATAASGPTLSVVQGQVPVTELANWIDHQLRWYCAMLGLSVDAFLKVNTSLTASARLFSAQDRQAQRDKVKTVLAPGETDLARLVADVCNLTEALRVPSDRLTVEVQWTDGGQVIDAQSQAQAVDARIKASLTTPDEVMAEERGISVSEARRQVDANRKRNAELGLVPGGGPEAVAPPAGGQTPPPADGAPVMDDDSGVA